MSTAALELITALGTEQTKPDAEKNHEKQTVTSSIPTLLVDNANHISSQLEPEALADQHQIPGAATKKHAAQPRTAEEIERNVNGWTLSSDLSTPTRPKYDGQAHREANSQEATGRPTQFQFAPPTDQSPPAPEERNANPLNARKAAKERQFTDRGFWGLFGRLEVLFSPPALIIAIVSSFSPEPLLGVITSVSTVLGMGLFCTLFFNPLMRLFITTEPLVVPIRDPVSFRRDLEAFLSKGRLALTVSSENLLRFEFKKRSIVDPFGNIRPQISVYFYRDHESVGLMGPLPAVWRISRRFAPARR